MRKILLLLTLILAPFSLWASPMIGEVITALKGLNPYRADIEVIYEGSSISGFYEVDGSEYYISIDQQELYGDASTKCEVFNSRKEVVIDIVSPDYNGNILNNPAMAFDSILNHYNATIIAENKGFTTINLKQNIAKEGDSESIDLTISTQTKLPTSILYRYGDEEILIRIISISKLSSSITLFDYDKYSDYEIIDFR